MSNICWVCMITILVFGFAMLVCSDDSDAANPVWTKTTTGAVWATALSYDGNLSAAGADNHIAYLFNKNTSQPIWTRNAGEQVRAIDISSDGKYIAAGSQNHRVHFFQKNSSTPLWIYKADHYIASVSVSGNGEYIVAGSADYNIYLFNKDSSTPIWKYMASSYIRSVAISKNGEYIVAGSANDAIYLFHKDSSIPIWTYVSGDDVASVAISENGTYITAGSYDNKIYLFHKNSSNPEWTYSTSGDVKAVAISGDGEFIVAGSMDRKVYFFHKNSSLPSWSYTTGGEIYAVDISDDGEYISAGSWDDRVYLFDKDSSVPLWSYRMGQNVVSASISGNGDYICAGVSSNTGSGNKVSLFHNKKRYAMIDSISPNPALVGEQVQFQGHGEDDGTIEAYEWNSSIDGTISEERTFSDDSLSQGVHSITFRVRDNDGVWSEKKASNLVIHEKPTAMIDNISSLAALLNEGITFEGSGIDDNAIQAYQWNSSLDGIISSNSTFTSSTLSLGIHKITFRVQDEHETWSNETSTSIVIHTRPVAIIERVSTNIAVVDERIYFDGVGIDDGQISDYEWNSSLDGFLSNEESFNSSKLSLGKHNITLIVKDNYNAWSNRTNITILIHQKPIASIDSISPLKALQGDLITFNASGMDPTGSIEAYEWKSNLEGQLSLERNFSIRLNVLGTHTISLRVEDDYGVLSDWSTQPLIIVKLGAELPVATIISINPSPANVSEIVSFQGSGSHSIWQISQYAWISNLQGLLSENASFTTDSLHAGTHTISFKVIDETGVVSSVITQDIVIKGQALDDDDSFGKILGLNPLLLIIILVVIIGAIIGMIVMLNKGRQSINYGTPPSQSTPPPQTDTGPLPSSQPPQIPEPAEETPPPPPMATIECPGCQVRMEIPKLGRLQQIRCEGCGLEGELDI